MDISNDSFVSLGTVRDVLTKLCQEARTGTLYLLTDKEQGAAFAISRGKITNVMYRAHQGMKALPLLSEIASTKYIFKRDQQPANQSVAEPGNSLPSNEAIMRMLGREAESVSNNIKLGTLKKILVVEDSALARKSVTNMLWDEGYLVIEAADGEEALEKLVESEPDLILLDLILPKKDGYEVLAEIKKDERYKHTPVIVLTSRDALFDKLKGKMSGTDEYLTKPLQQDQLFDKVTKYLG